MTEKPDEKPAAVKAEEAKNSAQVSQGTQGKNVDSFGHKVEKSPWFIYAMLQIPIVAIMVIIIYVMYRNSQN